ncbi:amidohydrolase family protein [Pseudomonas fluorescens]|jgi:predicted TIM-barrel fold metal-dependent hydrolase|uniref:amidohydrolase family protein n=1 Tax=Pseudomonas fluorescens TaxID=294 RepID=UPI0019112912|nr:amidohydrolase family protein [Pseudomonas fluorescens]
MITLHERNGMPSLAAEDALPLIDAHHHLWDLGNGRYPWLQEEYHEDFFLGDYRHLRKDFLPGHFLALSQRQRLVGTVHVEAERARDEQLAETRWLEQVHARFGFPNAIVAHAWFDREDSADILAAQAAHPLVKGIRSKPVTSASPHVSVAGARGTLQDPRWLEGFSRLADHDLSWDLRVPPWHLVEAAEVAAMFPRIQIALNHTGFAWDRSPEGMARWRKGLEALALQPNVHIKLSEFGLKDSPWHYEDNRLVVLTALEIFGARRCMFASNFPVAGLRASYDTIADGVARMLAPMGRAVQEAVFAGNARRFYRLEPDHE